MHDIKQDTMVWGKGERCGVKDKNNENNNKKKKNRIISNNHDGNRCKGLNQCKKTQRNEKSQRAQEKIFHKTGLSNKQENKGKKLSKKLNNSPIKAQKKNPNSSEKQYSQSRSKSKSPSTSRKNTAKVKFNDQKVAQALKQQQLGIKQRKSKSPINKKKVKSKQKPPLKNQNMQRTPKRQNYYYTPIKIQHPQDVTTNIQNQSIEFQYLSPKAKLKKNIPQIRTQFSTRKKSFIDQSLLYQLQNHKQNKNVVYIQDCLLRSIKKQEYKGGQSQRKRNGLKNSKEMMQVLKFKRQQERKWQWMLEQIKNLKNQQQIENKIDLLITEITENYQYLQKKVEAKTIVDEEKEAKAEEEYRPIDINQTYPNLSVEIGKLQVQPVAKQQSRSHMISLQDFFNCSNKIDKNLKRELFSLDSKEDQAKIIQKVRVVVEEKQEDNNELLIKEQPQIITHIHLQETQKEVTLRQDQSKNIANRYQQIHLSNLIQDTLINQFCQTILRNKKILHCYLIHFDELPNSNPNPKDFVHYEQSSSNQYSLALVDKLLGYLFTHCRQYIFEQISYYYQCKPLQILRYVRCNYQQQQTVQLSYQIQNQKEIAIPFLGLQLIYQFETEILKNDNYSPHNLNLNYFNQCIYDTFNDVFDSIRPYGSKGKPIFTKKFSHAPSTELAIRSRITDRFDRILKQEWDEQFINDNLTHGQQGNFQIIYFVCLEITQIIYNESVMELGGLLLHCK